jgi:hypothetical protein
VYRRSIRTHRIHPRPRNHHCPLAPGLRPRTPHTPRSSHRSLPTWAVHENDQPRTQALQTTGDHHLMVVPDCGIFKRIAWSQLWQDGYGRFRHHRTVGSFRTGSEDGVPGPLSAFERASAGGQRRVERDRVVEPRELEHLLRQELRTGLRPARRAGDERAVPVDLPSRDGVLTAEDEAATPLFWSHVLPYGD